MEILFVGDGKWMLSVLLHLGRDLQHDLQVDLETYLQPLRHGLTTG